MRVVVAHDYAGQTIQVVHDGAVYGSGETLDVTKPLAQFWITSGWAHAEHEADAESEANDTADAEDVSVVKPAPTDRTSATSKVARSHRRDPRRSKAD